MSSQYNVSTDLSDLVVEYFDKRALDESEIKNDLLMRGVKGTIPKGNSATIHWHRWTKFGIASDLSEGSAGDPTTGESMAVTDVEATLVEFGSFLRVPLFGDSLLIESMVKQGYDKFIEQAARTANRRLMTALVAGDSTTNNSLVAFTKRYAGYATGGSFASLTQAVTMKDIMRAVAFIEKNNPPTGKIYCALDAFTKADLMIDDTDFRDLIKHQDLNILARNNLPSWAGCFMDHQSDPWRESSAGAEETYAAAGDIVTCFIYHEKAFGVAQLMGKGGLKPVFHVQNVSVTGSEMTIGYRVPFKGGGLNASWGVQLRGKTADASVSSIS